MKNKIFLLSILFFAVVPIIFAQTSLNKTAQSTMNFLLVSTSPRASALGEAFTSISKGSESMFYNPAGLSEFSKEFEINLSYTQWIADINYLSGGVAYNFGNYGVIGLNLLTVDYGVINGTSLISESQNSYYPLGYIDNGPVSNIGAYCIGLSYSKAISTQFSVGGTVKLAGQNLGNNLTTSGAIENDASKIVFDAGVLYKTGFKDFKFGMSIRNFASNIKREEYDEQLPLVFSLGSSIDLMQIIDDELSNDNSVTISTDFMHFNNYSERLNFGLEYKYANLFAFRLGYQTNRDLASWSGGAAFYTTLLDYDLQLNYSYSIMKYFSDVNRLSLVFCF